jgi:hypothetical protein
MEQIPLLGKEISGKEKMWREKMTFGAVLFG